MPDLAQRLLCDMEFDGGKPAHLARRRKQTASKDDVRPPRPDERGAIDQPRDTLCVAFATFALTAANPLAVILGTYLAPDPPSARATIDAIAVKDFAKPLIKSAATGHPHANNKTSSALGP